ncbi:choice-of-anchor J domain-containing protein [Ferruginibacter sp.]|nr:T9SS type A sorting domain-containing protein [Ferruginibacter sp.]
MSKPSSARKGLPTAKPTSAATAVQQSVGSKKFGAASFATTEATDVPAINKQAAEKLLKNPGLKEATASIAPTTNPTGNIVNDVCTFNGSLVTGDLTLTNGRFFRDGVGSTCAGAKVCPGAFGTGPYFYDTYTMQNNTCASQCVTVNYIANVGGGDVFVAAYNGSFSPANLCTNYMADGGSSSLSGGAAVTFTFNIPANATVVFVAMAAQISTACPSYTMTVTGINCAPPPTCTPPTSSILGQATIPGPTVNLFNEQFDGTIPPAGWPVQNLSSPVGVTGWSQTNSAVFAPQSGVGFASANFNNTAGTGTISNWMFTPNITLKNGDKFSFYTRTTTGTFPDRLQLRQSTNGASVNAGADANSVGDFTTLLLDINPTLTGTGYPTAWTQFTVTMSGLPAAGVSGRLAFRYFVTGGGPAGNNSDFIGIDNAVYTSFTQVNPNTCTGSTANLKVDITGGTSPTYKVVIGATPATPGFPMTVTGYVSGANIPVTPSVTTTYNLVSVVAEDNCTCIGTGNTGTPTVTVSPTTVAGITVIANPAGTLCAGDPTLLTIIGAPSVGTATVSSGPIAVAIPDGNATGVATNLVVAGIPATAVGTSASVTFNISHTWDSDLTLFLKNGTNNQVLNLVNQRGGTGDNFTNTVISSTAVTPISAGLPPFTGTFLPDANLAAPAPTGTTVNAASFTPLINTAGTLNGTWSLLARDLFSFDAGTITSWGLTINYSVPAGPPVGYTFLWSPAAGISSTTSNPTAASPMTTTTYTVMGTAPNGCQTTAAVTININQLPAVVSQPSNLTVCALNNATFSITGSGAGITYQWQVSTNAGVSYSNVTNGGVYSGATSNTLTITGVPATFNTYRFRCVVSGTCPPSANSAGAILTVNPLPAVVVTPGTPVCGGIAGTNGTLLTATGASTFSWSPATGLYSNAAATVPYVAGTLTPTVYAAPAVNTVYTVTGTNGTTGCIGTTTVGVTYTPKAPTVSPSSVTMCLGSPAVPISVTSALAPSPFSATYSSGPISVAIPEGAFPSLPATAGVSTIPVTLPSTAAITNIRVTMNISHAYVGDVVAVLKAPNGEIINLDAMLNKTNNPGANFVNTVISSTGTTLLSAGTAPFTNTFKADLVGATYVAFGATLAGGPVGYTPTQTTWAPVLASTPAGNWTLAMHDVGAPDLGSLTSWSISFDYLYGPPASGVWSPVTGLYLDALASQNYVAGTSVNTVYTKPASSTTYSVTVESVGPDSTKVFSNPAAITINDGSTASPYPAAINVSGLPTAGAKVQSVTITGLSHTWSDDVDVLLQSPTGTNVTLMSDIGGTASISNVTYTFSDAAGAMSATAGNPSGTYKPTNNGAADTYPGAGPGAVNDPTPALASFTGNANGTWKLFVVDDTFGDQGNITGGYSITFTYPTKGCTSGATQVPVTVNLPLTFNPNLPADAVVCTDKVTSFTSSVGGSVINHNWRVSTDNGNNWSDVANGGVYSGAKTATLTITAPPVSMTTYLYKDSVHTIACRDSSSRIAKLIVNPLPTITISASPYQKLFPGLTTTLFSTVSPMARVGGYTWLRNGSAVAGANSSSLLVRVDQLGDYRLTVTDTNGCVNTSSMTVSITDSISGKVFVYPNPNDGRFQVRYHSVINNSSLPRGVNIYDARGKRILTQTYSINAPYARMDIDLSNQGTGVYWVEVVDVNGNRLAMGRAEVLR